VCGSGVSDQTESLHYFAKRHVPFHAIWNSLTSGASQRAIAERYRLSPQALQNAVIRLGRQAMACQAVMLHTMHPLHSVVIDGLRSFVTSQDYPCDLTMLIDSVGEAILSIEHTVMHRGGRMRDDQLRRVQQKMQKWKPKEGRYTLAIALLFNELWDYFRPPEATTAAVLHSDKHQLYRALASRHPVCSHFALARLFEHKTVSSHAPRTRHNPLFPANYVDLLMRHRMKEHTRQTIAFGRNAVSQMHRAWIFAWDHNANRAHRTRNPHAGVHAEQAVSDRQHIAALRKQFFTRRVDLAGIPMPHSIAKVWLQQTETPPLRWKIGQKGTSLHLPRFAIADKRRCYQHGC